MPETIALHPAAPWTELRATQADWQEADPALLQGLAPATPFDYVGLMNAALLCNDPVLVIEHVDLYQSPGPAPAEDLDFIEAVERLGLDVEIVDLRSLDRASLDWETIETSVRKTNNVLIVEQGPIGTSYGGFLADEIQRRLMDWLDQPVQRINGAEAAPTISKVLEPAACAGTEDVMRGLARCMAAKGAPLSDLALDQVRSARAPLIRPI